MKPTVRRSAVVTRDGYPLAPILPSLRLDEISERARIRAKAARMVRFDRLEEIRHQRILTVLDSWGIAA